MNGKLLVVEEASTGSLEMKQGFFSEEILRPCVFANSTMKEHFAIGLKDNLCT